MVPNQLVTVYHAACMGSYRQVIPEQLRHLADVGIRNVLCTHVGPDLAWLQAEAVSAGVQLVIEQSDANLHHYETLAMLLIERLARWHAGAFLYLHTKGVSQPGSTAHHRWRQIMQDHTVARWRENLAALDQHDVAGVDWLECPGNNHFSGNFWLARADWIRRLPPFAAFHHARRLERYSCEMWLGQAANPRVLSLFTRGVPWWQLVAM